MPKVVIPTEWELRADPRYKRQNMERAMKGRIERGLVELITNSDDSYRNLEDEGKQASGKIRVEIERRKIGQPSTVIVRDRAEGMDRVGMYHKLGVLGERTSGFEKGKPRRGLHGRGARDVAAFGTVHFESIKEDEYNHLIIPPSLRCRFEEPHPGKVTSEIRKKLGIPRGNGTIVTIEVENRFPIPQHETLLKDFSRYYSLRDLFSNPRREVTLVDLNKKREDPLLYKYPSGEPVYDGEIVIPDYAAAKARLVVYKHPTPFEQGILPYREGILVKSAAAIHDCTYFELESEAVCWILTGQLFCEYIDQLIREYDDREEADPDNPNHPVNNPQRLLDPFRDGLIREHPFVRELYKKCKETLETFIEELKATEKPPKRDVTDKDLERKLRSLSREISRIFEEKLRELEEEITPGIIPKELSLGLHIIPPDEQPIIVNQPKTFSVIVKHYEALDESLPVNVGSSDPDNVRIRTSPVFLRRLLEDGKVGRTTFTVESDEVGAEAFVEARYGGYSNLVLIKVVEPPPPPPLPDGLTFEKPQYHLQINKEKALVLRLKTIMKPTNSMVAEITSDHPDIVVKGGGRCILHETDMAGVLQGQCRVLGRQLKACGKITARVDSFEPAQTRVEVVEKPEPPGGIDFKAKPDESDFGIERYKWDDRGPYLLWIGAKHPSIRKYLGELTNEGYPGRSSPLYHAVLAEVIAEALAFRLLSVHFKKYGQQGMLDYESTAFYYHKQFSDFLPIAHKFLVTELP
ncbi:MAG: hypothetical protein ISS58_07090 [Dehalococcoidales bacterium]|nr:hypothetical protein [Dehalococcoidales bacterium]